MSISQSPEVEGHSPGPSTLSVSARGVVGRGVRRQHHSSGVYSQAGRNSLASPEQEGSTPAPVGGESTDSSVASVCDGHNVVADSLSRPNEVIGSKWTLVQEVVDQLVGHWPANIDLFATALNHRMPVYFAPMVDRASSGTAALLQPWNHLQAYAFPPFRLVRQVINKFLESTNCEITLVALWWPQQEWFPELQRLVRFPPVALPLRRDFSDSPTFIISTAIRGCCVFMCGTVRRFAREWGISSAVARQLANCHWPSSQRLYQHRWLAGYNFRFLMYKTGAARMVRHGGHTACR